MVIFGAVLVSSRLQQLEKEDIPARDQSLKQEKAALANIGTQLADASDALETVSKEASELEGLKERCVSSVAPTIRATLARNDRLTLHRVSEIVFTLDHLRTIKRELDRARLEETAVIAQGTPSNETLQQVRRCSCPLGEGCKAFIHWLLYVGM